MRTERPTPWGFDIWNPRLELRRAAADAQREAASEEVPAGEDPPALDETTPFEWPALEPVGAGRGERK